MFGKDNCVPSESKNHVRYGCKIHCLFTWYYKSIYQRFFIPIFVRVHTRSSSEELIVYNIVKKMLRNDFKRIFKMIMQLSHKMQNLKFRKNSSITVITHSIYEDTGMFVLRKRKWKHNTPNINENVLSNLWREVNMLNLNN